MALLSMNDSYNPLILTADNHNVASGEPSMFDDVNPSNAGAFIAVSAASGFNSLLNSGKAIGNFLGGDFEERDTEAVIRDYDDNLANYYSEVKPYADVAGFLATSLVPGMAGVKLYNAGSKALWAAKGGNFGLSTAEATGLLAPFREKYLTAAVRQLQEAPTLTKLTNANYLKAVGMGVGENALQSLAFEAAVAATMFKSPIFDDMDKSDMANNMLWNAAFGGVIGGAFQAATGYQKIRTAITAFDKDINQYRMIADVPAAAPDWYKTRNYMEQYLKEFDEAGVPTGVDVKQASREFTNRKIKLEQKVIESIKPLTKGDDELANIVGHDMLKITKIADVDAALLKLESISRVADDLEVGKPLAGDLKSVTLGTKAAGTQRKATAFVNSIDGEMDEVLMPRVGDFLAKGEKITFGDSIVKAGGKTYQLIDNVIDSAVDAVKAEATWLHALNAPQAKFEFRTFADAPVGINNLPKLERAHKFFDEMVTPEVRIADLEGNVTTITSKPELRKLIDRQKFLLTEELQRSGMDFREISQRLNVSRKFAKDPSGSLMATNGDAERLAHLQYMENAGRRTEGGLQTNPFLKPTSYKVTYDTELSKFSKERVQAETYFRSLDKEMKKNAAALAANNLSNGTQYPQIGVDKILNESTRLGAGSGNFTFANGEYLSLESTMEYIGRLTADEMIRKGASVSEELSPVLHALKGNKEELLQFNIIDAKLRGTPNKYAFIREGLADMDGVLYDWSLRDAVEAMKQQGGDIDWKYLQGVAKGEIFDTDLHKLIDFTKRRDPDADMIIRTEGNVTEFVDKHIKTNDARLATKYEVAKQRGLPMADFRGTFYAPPIDTTRYPYYAIVRDSSYGGGGSMGYLFAATPAELEARIASIPVEDGFQVLRANEIKDFKKVIGEYKYDLSINENKVNSMLYRKGLLKPFAPATDSPKTLDEYLSHHVRTAEQEVRDVVDNLYSAEFRTLRNMAKEQELSETSTWSSAFSKLQASKNPYEDYVKTALNVSRKTDFPLTTISTFIEDHVDRAWNAMKFASQKAKSADDLEDLNKVMKENGLGEPYTSPLMELYANTSYDRGMLRKAVAKMNNVMSSMILGMDSINAMNNVIGSAVLQSSEIRYLQKLVLNNPELKEKFDKLYSIKVPGRDDIRLAAPAKLQARAMAKFWSEDGTKLLQRYKDEGYIQDDLYRMKTAVMDAALTGSENFATIGKKADALFDKAREFTGNKKAEELTRFMSVHIIEEFTEPLVKAGILKPQQAATMKNTFVNRVNGNYLASQRPMITQSAVGQATTLFLTYQANLMQQFFKYAANGDRRAMMTMMGTQGMLYGMQGLPGFDLVNSRIAMMAGNPNHEDVHSFTQGTVGQEGYEWLMYGLGSNALGVISPELKFNLYSRGDINPRNPTIISLDPTQVPSVAMTAKAVGSMYDAITAIDNGAATGPAFLQAIEHIGINRPIAGLAAAINGRSTTGVAGSMVSDIDWNDVGTYVRVLGAKPMDEAVALDWYYRNKVISAHEKELRTELGKAVKTAYQDGGVPSEDQLQTFMEEYTKAGGDIKGFNRFMVENMKKANESIFAESRDMLRSDYALSLQRQMGGALYADYVEEGFEEPELQAMSPEELAAQEVQ